MASLLADRLSAARRRQFVGRTSETDVFRSAVTSEELPFFVLHIHGPGGVGKTTLLKEFGRLAEESGTVAVYLDARSIEPAPAPFLDALRTAMGLEPSDSPLQSIAATQRRHAILIDTYETLEPLDIWLSEEFLPQLPEQVMVVTAGRNAPSPAWRSDPGWQELVRTIPLRNLAPDESRAYLSKRNVPAEQHQSMLEFTHGHPLALSLIADTLAQRESEGKVDSRFQPGADPNIVKMLLERFVQKVPGPAHRAALECCALVRVTTEALLSTLLEQPDVHEIFDWMRGLSFIETTGEGIFPHDLARESLVTDLRWRNPDWNVELHHRARKYYAAKLQQAHSYEQQRLLFDYVYLHRENVVIREMFKWQGAGSTLADLAHENDLPALETMVGKHEGAESARLLRYWFERQPEGMLVLRDIDGVVVGLTAMVALQRTSEEDRRVDPATHSTWHYLQSHAPLRPGENATLFRFWMARDTYQYVSPVQSLIFVNVARHYLTTPGLAYTFFPCANADVWAPGFAYVDLHRHREADFTVGENVYGVYGHDWRVVPPVAWLALLAEREMTGGAGESAPAPTPSSAPLVVLSEEEFNDAVCAALRDYTRPDALETNPLLRSRLIAEQLDKNTDMATRVETLRRTIHDAAETMKSSPREEKFHRVIERTYLKPAATQERAAELLDLPFSTYRRHLKSGITEIVRVLWRREMGNQGMRAESESSQN